MGCTQSAISDAIGRLLACFASQAVGNQGHHTKLTIASCRQGLCFQAQLAHFGWVGCHLCILLGFVVEVLELVVHTATGKHSLMQTVLPATAFMTFANPWHLSSSYILTRLSFNAVVFGACTLQLFAKGVYLAAQQTERYFKKSARRVNGNQRAHGRQAIYATHSARRLTWTLPPMFHLSSWIPAAMVALVVLAMFPRMPAMPTSPPNSPTQTPQPSTSGLTLPPATVYDPPQWFDPPKRDQVFWLDNLCTAVSQTAKFSWEFLSLKLPTEPNADAAELHHLSPSPFNLPPASHQPSPLPLNTPPASREGTPPLASTMDYWPNNTCPRYYGRTGTADDATFARTSQPSSNGQVSDWRLLMQHSSGTHWQPAVSLGTTQQPLIAQLAFDDLRLHTLYSDMPMSAQLVKLQLPAAHSQSASTAVMLYSASTMQRQGAPIMLRPSMALPIAMPPLAFTPGQISAASPNTTAVALWRPLTFPTLWETCPAEPLLGVETLELSLQSQDCSFCIAMVDHVTPAPASQLSKTVAIWTVPLPAAAPTSTLTSMQQHVIQRLAFDPKSSASGPIVLQGFFSYMLRSRFNITNTHKQVVVTAQMKAVSEAPAARRQILTEKSNNGTAPVLDPTTTTSTYTLGQNPTISAGTGLYLLL